MRVTHTAAPGTLFYACAVHGLLGPRSVRQREDGTAACAFCRQPVVVVRYKYPAAEPARRRAG